MSTADRGGKRGVVRYVMAAAVGEAVAFPQTDGTASDAWLGSIAAEETGTEFVLATSYDALAAERYRLRAMLEEVEAWLEDREDVVDGDYGESAPNAEMRLLREVRAALSGGRT